MLRRSLHHRSSSHSFTMCEAGALRRYEADCPLEGATHVKDIHSMHVLLHKLSLLSAPFSLRPLVDGKKDGSAPCTAAIVAGFQNLPSWQPLAYQNSLSSSYVQIRDSSDLLGLPPSQRNHSHQTCVFPIFPLTMGNVQGGAKNANIDLGTPQWALGNFAVSIHVPLS